MIIITGVPPWILTSPERPCQQFSTFTAKHFQLQFNIFDKRRLFVEDARRNTQETDRDHTHDACTLTRLLTAEEELTVCGQRKWDADVNGGSFVFVHRDAQVILSRVQLHRMPLTIVQTWACIHTDKKSCEIDQTVLVCEHLNLSRDLWLILCSLLFELGCKSWSWVCYLVR